MNAWKFEDARDCLDEVVRAALGGEPQLIGSGRDAVVVMSAGDYNRLVPPQDLFTFMQSSPLAEAIAAGEFELPERERDFGRDVSLPDDD